MKNITAFISGALIIASGLIATPAFAATPASFTASPSASSVANGGSFSVTISENGDNVNTVTAKLSFDASKVQLLGVTCGGSFAGSIAETNGITCYTNGGSTVNGSVVAATANFKAITGAGSATISMASSSKIVSATTNTNIWDGTSGSTSVALTTPVSSNPGQGSGSGTSTGAGSTGSTGSTSTGNSGNAGSSNGTSSASNAFGTTSNANTTTGADGTSQAAATDQTAATGTSTTPSTSRSTTNNGTTQKSVGDVLASTADDLTAGDVITYVMGSVVLVSLIAGIAYSIYKRPNIVASAIASISSFKFFGAKK